MPEQEHDFEDFEEGMEDELEEDGDDDEEGDDEPMAVFVSMAPGKDADEAFRVIAGVCERLELEAQRMPAKGGTETLYELIETSDFAIIDVSQKRPNPKALAEELEVTDHELDPAFVLFIAKTGSPPPPKPPELEGRAIQFYADKGDLRALIERSLNAMIDAWHEGGGGEEEEDEDDEEA